MKNFLLIIATSFILFSCSKNDDDIQNVTTSFFNINTGNKWVYNRYAISTLGSTSSIIQIDSVLVIGDTLINSISYKKIEHKEFTVNSNNLLQTYYEYLRIDSNDHLVDTNGYVFHPGFDSQYQNVYTHLSSLQLDYNTGNYGQNTWGVSTFQNVAPQNIIVEGQNYFVYDYLGNFVGNSSIGIPNNTIHYMYEEGIGMVLRRCPFVSSASNYYEDRLVSYVIN